MRTSPAHSRCHPPPRQPPLHPHPRLPLLRLQRSPSPHAETEADPLDEHSEMPSQLEQLFLRVAQLEQRVQVLEEHRDSIAQPPSSRKRRRRFEEMQREI